MSSLLYVNINNHENQSTQSSQRPQHRNSQQYSQQKQITKANKLLIDPESVNLSYELQKTTIFKLTLKNDYNFKINFKIIQPKKAIFNVKSKKLALNPKEIIEIYLLFNGDKEKLVYEDEFIIFLQKQKIKLYVPIICKPKWSRTSSHRKLSFQNKTNPLQIAQNLIIKQRVKPKLLTLKKTKTSNSMDFVYSMDSMINGFMDKFNHIDEFVKQKNVKKEIFIGQKALSLQKHNKISSFNIQVKACIQAKIKSKVQLRLKVQFSSQGPVVRNLQGLILRWNKQKNTPRMIYQKGLAKVQQQVRKYLVNLRFQKIHCIFSLYRQFQNSNQHNSLPMHKRHEIYIQKLQKKLNKKSQISLQLVFDRNSVIVNNIQVQHKAYSPRKNNIFQINPRIGFDNWVAIQESIQYTHQIMDYAKKQPIPQWMCHPKLQEQINNSSTSGCMNSAKVTRNQLRQSQGDANQLDLIMQSLRIYSHDNNDHKDQIKQNDNQEQRKYIRNVSFSRGQLKIGSTRNLKARVIPSAVSIKNIPGPSNEHIIKQNKLYEQTQVKQQDKAMIQTLNHIFKHRQHKNQFLPYLHQQSQDLVILYQQRRLNEIFILKDIRKQRYNIDCLNNIFFAKQQLQAFKQQPNIYIVDFFLSYKNNILRKVPKQDKHEFDRLDSKAQRILEWIQNNQRQKEFKNYKLRGQVDIQIPIKSKIKSFGNSALYEKNIQNIGIYKKDVMGKSQCLEAYFHQYAKKKANATFIG